MKEDTEKKTAQVNCWMSPRDFNLLQRAARKQWPEAEMSKSHIILSLAKMAAKRILGHRDWDSLGSS
jgi:hypothetical protein